MAILPAAPAFLAALFGGAALVAMGGCEKRVSPGNIEYANKLQDSAQKRSSRWPGINEGMTEKEVESILGQPSKRRMGKPVEVSQPVEMPTVTYVYEQDGQTIELHF